MESELEEIKNELKAIKERNQRVEAEKAWEQSFFRKVLILISTYVIAGIVFLIIGVEHPWRNALIPTIAYFVSIQSLPLVKKRWIVHYLKNKGART